MTTLVLAPHTDDEVFGCGGTIARMVDEGHEVHVAVFSACMLNVPPPWPSDQLVTEMKAAAAVLRIKPEHLHQFDFQVRTFDRHRQEILQTMIKLRDRVEPHLVMKPWRHDVHQDHQVVAEEALRAFKFTTLLSYELPWNTVDGAFPADTFYELKEYHLQRKADAIACYQTQAQRPYSKGIYWTNIAFGRGLQAGVDYAEAFHTVRNINTLTP